MKPVITFLLSFIFLSAFSQDIPEKRSVQTYYIPLKEYKRSGKEITRQDSLDFKFHRGDTLVKMPPDFIPKQDKNRYRLKYDFRKAEFLDTYKDIVFQKEGDHLRLWEKEIKMYFHPSIPEKHRNALRDFAAGLSAGVDSLKISEVQNQKDSNFQLYYTNSKDTIDHEPNLKTFKSNYWVYWDKRNRLESGFVKINTDSIKNPVYQIANLKYQFFYSLGMFRSSTLAKSPGYLSYSNKIRSLNSHDMEILKYHYSYGKPNGVDRKGFEKFHREIQEVYQKNPSAEIYISTSE